MVVDKKYSYDRFGTKGSRVGQAVLDLTSSPQPQMTVEDVLEEMGTGIVDYIQEAAEKGCKAYDSNFYILHLFKKALYEHSVENAMLQKATCFKDREWSPKEVMEAHPTSAKTLFLVDKVNGVIKCLWTVSGREDCRNILKNPHTHDGDLVKWAKEACS